MTENIKNIEIMNHVNDLYEKSQNRHCMNC